MSPLSFFWGPFQSGDVNTTTCCKFPVVPLLLCLTSQLININAGFLGKTKRHANQTEWNNQATQQSHAALAHPHSPPIINGQSHTSRQHNPPVNPNQHISQKTVNNNSGSQFPQSLNAGPFQYQSTQNRGSQEVHEGRAPQTVSSSAKTGHESKVNFQTRTSSERRFNQSLTNQQPRGFGSGGPQLSSISNLDTRKAKKVPLVLITIHKPRGGNAQKSRTKVDAKAQNQKSVEDATSNISNFQRRPNQKTYGQSHSFTGQNSNSPIQPPRFESNVQSKSRNNENIKTATSLSNNPQLKTDDFGSNQWHPVDKYGGKISDKITSNAQENHQTNGRQAKNENVSQIKDASKLSQEVIQTNPAQAPEETTSFVRKPIMNYDSRPFYVENGNSLNNHNHQVQPAVYVVSNDKNQQNLAQNYPYIISFPNTGSIENQQNRPSVRQQSVGVHTHVSTAEVVHFPSTQSQNTDTTHLTLRNPSPQTYYNIDSLRSNSDSHEKKILIPAIVEQKSRDQYSGQSLFQTGGHSSRENGNLEHNFPQQIITDISDDNITESSLSQGTGNNYLNLKSLNNIFSSNQMQQMLALAIEQTRNPYNDNLNYLHNSQQNDNSESDSKSFFQTDNRNANSHMTSSVIMQKPFNAPRHSQKVLTNADVDQQFPQHVIFPSSDKPEHHEFNDGGSFVVNQKTATEPTFKNKQVSDNSHTMSNDRRSPLSVSIPSNSNFNQHSSMEITSQNNYNSKNEDPKIQIQISPLENQDSGIPNVNIDPRLRNEQLSQSHYNVPSAYFPYNNPNEFSHTHTHTQVNEQTTISNKKEIDFNLDARKIATSGEVQAKTIPSVSNQYRGFPNFPTSTQVQQPNSNPSSFEQNNRANPGQNPDHQGNSGHTRAKPRPNEQAQTPNEYNPSVATSHLTHINEGNQKSSVPEALLLVLVSAQRSLESESDIRDHQSQEEEYPDQVGQESIPQVAILRSILEAAGRQYNNGMVQKDTAVDTRRRSASTLSGR